MKYKFFLLSISLTFLLPTLLTHLCAQEAPPPIEWGNIPRADLEMKIFPKDTNAAALILCDYGESRFNNEFNLVFRRHLRVKILATKGYEWGTHSISLYTVDNTERISDIEGTTYWLNEKGEVEKSELNEDDIFKEEASEKYTRYKFTLPNLKPGCIIEIRYSIESKNPALIKDWVFQHSEPVRWSEYRITHPKMIGYAIVRLGYENYQLDETQEVSQIFDGAALSYVGTKIASCWHRKWAIKDAPAIREEPYTTTTKDYLSRVDVQLSGYSIKGMTTQVLKDWESLIEELMESNYFGEKIDDTGKVTDLAESIVSGLLNTGDKVNAVYDWISSSITCTGRNTFSAEESVNDVLETKKGNNAEITFLFISMLKSIGIEAQPVLVSTRSNGLIQDMYPIISQFNYVFARVKIDSQFVFVDATSPLRPIELLPTEVLNVRGLIIKEGKPEWINITTNKLNTHHSITSLKLYPDGSIEGSIEDTYYDYGALSTRRDIKDKNDKEIAKKFFDTDMNGINVDSLIVFDKDDIKAPIKLTAKITSPNYALANSDIIYINPQIVHRTQENPFKTIIRKYPVDYAYKRFFSTIVNITIPEGYEIKEKINDRTFVASPELASYMRKVNIEGNKIVIQTKFDIKATQIHPKYYERIRYFYTMMVAAQSEQIVLARKQIVPVQTIDPNQSISRESKPSTVKGKK